MRNPRAFASISRQRSAVSGQPMRYAHATRTVVSGQQSAVSRQPSAVSGQPLTEY
ncbi:hypothetical protein BJP36_43545 [Moorena producens JHB]|uniref:Uncharacterized protein n=1 Tax=Moorena producens (strain JHB) TaxID=1454205 RepID=A0A9Q9STA8_MOOP1|nr:hypothetical protein [Moorena producens]WAN69238.1 hypothetical protein BJP36_43545 [Moorena producens JHB]